MSRDERDRATRERNHWLVRPGTIRLLWATFIGVLLLSVAPDFAIHQHEHFGIEDVFGFYAAYGFLTCVAMVVGAKALGLLIKRSDRYYADDREEGSKP